PAGAESGEVGRESSPPTRWYDWCIASSSYGPAPQFYVDLGARNHSRNAQTDNAADMTVTRTTHGSRASAVDSAMMRQTCASVSNAKAIAVTSRYALMAAPRDPVRPASYLRAANRNMTLPFLNGLASTRSSRCVFDTPLIRVRPSPSITGP